MSYLYNKRNNNNNNDNGNGNDKGNGNIEANSLPDYSHNEWNERKRRYGWWQLADAVGWRRGHKTKPS